HNIERLVTVETRQQVARAVLPDALDRIVANGGPSAESLLDDQPAVAECVAHDAGPALVRRIAVIRAGDRRRPPGVGIAVTENRIDHRPPLSLIRFGEML